MYICKMYSDSFPQKVSEYSLLRHDKYYTILQVCSQTKKSQSCIVIAKEWSPGLVVMGDDSCSRGRGFKFRHHILDGHDIFSHQFVVKIVVCLKRPKINEKEAGDGPFLQKMLQLIPNRTLTSRNPMQVAGEVRSKISDLSQLASTSQIT